MVLSFTDKQQEISLPKRHSCILSIPVKRLGLLCAMTSPEKEAELPGAQLSFVFGSSVVRAPIPRTPPEDADPQEPAECYSTETLCLSRSQLKHVPDSPLRNSKLKVSVDSKHTPATWCMLQWLSSRRKNVSTTASLLTAPSVIFSIWVLKATRYAVFQAPCLSACPTYCG